MTRIDRDEAREHRITMEAVVDAYGPEEQAMGWYYYLADKLSFPFEATCVSTRPISPLQEGEMVEVTEMAPEDECLREMFVTVRWQGRALAVPLAQLEPTEVDDDTEEAAADWRYWVARGYELA